MVRMGRAAALACAMLVTGLVTDACSAGPKAEAARAAGRLLAAVQTQDRAAFEAVVDRPALRSDLRDQIVDMARNNAVEVDGGPSEFALDRMISPRAVRLVDAGSGQPLAAAPSAAQIKGLLRMQGRRRACLADAPQGPCLLSFARGKQGWRLVGLRAGQPTLALPPRN